MENKEKYARYDKTYRLLEELQAEMEYEDFLKHKEAFTDIYTLLHSKMQDILLHNVVLVCMEIVNLCL